MPTLPLSLLTLSVLLLSVLLLLFVLSLLLLLLLLLLPDAEPHAISEADIAVAKSNDIIFVIE